MSDTGYIANEAEWGRAGYPSGRPPSQSAPEAAGHIAGDEEWAQAGYGKSGAKTSAANTTTKTPEPETNTPSQHPLVAATFGTGAKTWQDIWPIRLGKGIVQGAIEAGKELYGLPHDVMTGQVAPTSDEAVRRSLGVAATISPASTAARGAVTGAMGAALPAEEAATRQAVRAPERAVAEQAAKTAEEAGQPLPWSQVGPSQAAVPYLEKIPFAGGMISGPAAKQTGNAIGAVGGKFKGLVSQLAGSEEPTRFAAGEVLAPALKDIVGKNHDAIKDVFDRQLRPLLDQSRDVDLPNTAKALDQIKYERRKLDDPEAGLADVSKLVKEGGTFDTVQLQRRLISDEIKWGKSHEGLDQKALGDLRDALTADMEHVVREQARSGVNPDVAAAVLKRANETAAPLIKFDKDIEKLMGNKTSEELAGTVIRAANAKTGNQRLLGQLRGAMDPEDFSKVTGAALHEMGFEGKTFNLNQFSREWNKLSDAAKAQMFEPAHKRMLDDVAVFGAHLKDQNKLLEQAAKKTSAGAHVGVGVVGAEAFYHAAEAAMEGHFLPMAGLLTAGAGGYGMGKWLSRPATAASIARWSRAASAIQQAPQSAIRRSALVIATRNLLNNIAPDLQQRPTVTVPRPATSQQTNRQSKADRMPLVAAPSR